MPSIVRPAAGLAGLAVALAACTGVTPTPRYSDAELRAMEAEREALSAEVLAERRARDEPQVALPPSTIEVVTVPAGVTRLPPTPGVAVAHRCRNPGADAPPSVALLQSGGDEESDLAFLHTRLTRPASEAPAATPRCAIVANITLPSRDADSRAQVVEPMALDVLRVSGEKRIYPSDTVRTQIARAGQRRLLVPVVVCIDRGGRVSDLELLQSSGYLAYDLDLINGVATWKYKPYELEGEAQSVCSVVQFLYMQRDGRERVGGPMKFGVND